MENIYPTTNQQNEWNSVMKLWDLFLVLWDTNQQLPVSLRRPNTLAESSQMKMGGGG